MNKNLIALVPMKAKSERVQNKNLRDFNGKPLMCYIIETLINTPCISKIVINTDSETIKEIASQYKNVFIHERPSYLCGHHIPMNKIIEFDLSILGDGYYLQTHATNPLLKSSTIDDACHTFFKFSNKYDSLVSVTKHQTRFFDHNFLPINHNLDILLNTQDLEPIYEENSNLYIFSYRSFCQKNNRIGLNPYFYSISKQESIDIDDENDFYLAEKLFSCSYSK